MHCLLRPNRGKVQYMNERSIVSFGRLATVCAWLVLTPGSSVAAEPTAAAVSAFNSYIRVVEARLDGQHKTQGSFLAGKAARLGLGELVVEKLTSNSDSDFPGAMVHDWRGTAFAPGATVADFERVMKDLGAYPQRFSPQVVRAGIRGTDGDRIQASMRVRQKHVITVVMDIDFDLTFNRLDSRHIDSASRGTRVAEIAAAGTAQERALGPAEEHGFLWRLNTYWSCEERDGGLAMQIESVSLTRAIPTGLGWAIGPFVESVPRESLEFTLRSMVNAVRK